MQENNNPSTRLTLIAAVALNDAIGYHNKLLYWLPNDLKRFKALTTGHTIIMGRRTFESLPKGALPNRRNIVLSRNTSFTADNIEVFASLAEALEVCAQTAPVAPNDTQPDSTEVFIIGGASVYREAMPLAQRLCLTIVEDRPELADAFFPEVDMNEWQITADEPHPIDERHAFSYRFVDFKRIS
ncbi:MAG: dihydrofolate reductase [Bacteroidales bacterium]|nr:dihydrofolate reductase [Bacteroidales bacterium]